MMKENSCPLAFGQLGFLSSSLESRDQALRPTLTVAQRDIKRDSATVSWPQGLHGLVSQLRFARREEDSRLQFQFEVLLTLYFIDVLFK